MARIGGEATAQAEGAPAGTRGHGGVELSARRAARGGERRRREKEERKGGRKKKREKEKKEKGKEKKKNRERETESCRRDSRRRSTHAHGGFSRKRLALGMRKRGTQGWGMNLGVGTANHRKKISGNQ